LIHRGVGAQPSVISGIANSLVTDHFVLDDNVCSIVKLEVRYVALRLYFVETSIS